MLVFGVLAFFANKGTAATGLGGAARRPARAGYRPVARRPDGLRDQSGARPRAADHARDPADPRQGRRTGPTRGSRSSGPLIGGVARRAGVQGVLPAAALNRVTAALRVPPGSPDTDEESDGEVRGSDRPGHHQHAVHGLRPRGQRRQRGPEGARADLPEAGLGRARRRRRSGRARRRSSTRRSTPPARAPTTSPASASPTSARRRSCGTRRPASRSTTRSCGRTRARTSSSTSTRPTAARRASRRRSACRWRPTSPARRSAGSSTTSTARRSGPIRVTCCSATWTPGSSGT